MWAGRQIRIQRGRRPFRLIAYRLGVSLAEVESWTVREIDGWIDFFGRRSGNEKIELLLAQILVGIAQIGGNKNISIRQVAPWLESEEEKRARIHAEQVARAGMISEIYQRQRAKDDKKGPEETG